jgi:hypothetical protein
MTLDFEGTRSSWGQPASSMGNAMAVKNRPDARGRELDTHRGQFALDSPVSPGWVLPCQSNDDLDRARGKAWSTWAVGIGSSSPQEIPMPAEQCLGLDEETSLANPRKESAEPGEQRSVRRTQRRACHLATEDCHLVTEHDDLDGEFTAFMARES